MTRERDSARSAAIRAEDPNEIIQRLGKLEAWVEVVMRTLATLGLESLVIELEFAFPALL
jgi:hypothetical protein